MSALFFSYLLPKSSKFFFTTTSFISKLDCIISAYQDDIYVLFTQGAALSYVNTRWVREFISCTNCLLSKFLPVLPREEKETYHLLYLNYSQKLSTVLLCHAFILPHLVKSQRICTRWMLILELIMF